MEMCLAFYTLSCTSSETLVTSCDVYVCSMSSPCVIYLEVYSCVGLKSVSHRSFLNCCMPGGHDLSLKVRLC